MSDFEAINREDWLQTAVTSLRALLIDADELRPPRPDQIRVACGFPRSDRNGKVIGQCWTQEAGKGFANVWISPLLDDPVEILATLLHEIIHAADDCEHGHKGPFVKTIRAVGLKGKPTETYAEEGSELYEHLTVIAAELGDYPHVKMNPKGKRIGPKKQVARQIKANCPVCGYTVRLSQKWIDVALPTCPDATCEGHYMEIEDKNDEQDPS